LARIERGELPVIGLNRFTETEGSPLRAGADGGVLSPDPEIESERREALERWRAERDQAVVAAALEALGEAARDPGANIMPATIEAARAGATTGEWAARLRETFGDYRAPTGVAGAAPARDGKRIEEIRGRVEEVSGRLGRRLRILVAKPGLDGHSNGAEQIAVRARDAGIEVVYQGIRLTPEQIASSAIEEDVDLVGLSILSGSHRELVPRVVELLRAEGAEVPVVVGGIIPPADAEPLLGAGVARIYTPKDFDLSTIVEEIVELIAERNGSAEPQSA
jgi:(2R)-ethylmalonyl-CoA mutase